MQKEVADPCLMLRVMIGKDMIRLSGVLQQPQGLLEIPGNNTQMLSLQPPKSHDYANCDEEQRSFPNKRLKKG